MKDKPTVINSGAEHRVSLSNDKRVAARSHMGKRAKPRPADRIVTGADFNDLPENIGSLQTSDQLAARIKMLAEVTAELQKELLAVQATKERAQPAAASEDRVGAVDEQVEELHQENKALQSELEALQARRAALPSDPPLPLPGSPHQPQSKSALKKKRPVPIQRLSDDEQFEVDLEARMQKIRQATQHVRIELEELVKSAEANG